MIARLPPVLRALLAQVAALLLLQLLQLQQPLWQGVLAALLGVVLRLPWWWIPINLALPVAAVYTDALSLPPWLFLLAFSVLLLLNWNSAGDRVPLYLSNRVTWEGLGELLPHHAGVRFIDIGSGVGGTLFYLARLRPNCHFTGIESSPLPYAIARLRLKLSGLENVELHYGNLWRTNLREYDVLYAFLSPAPMPALFDKLRRETADGALFISNSFTVPDEPADKIVVMPDRRKTQLHVWRFPRPGQKTR